MTPHPPVQSLDSRLSQNMVYFMDSIRYESYHFIEVQGLVQDQAEMPTDQAIRIPTVKLKIPWKSIFEIRTQNFCYIQVIVFDLSYLPVAAIGT